MFLEWLPSGTLKAKNQKAKWDDNRTNLGIAGIDIQIFMHWFDILCSKWQRGEESHTNMFK
jgi:hypothetical protein